jgi:hypothetical protein
VTFLSFLQDGCNRLLLESLVVLSLESHVGSVYQSSRLSIPSAIKSRQRTPLLRIASRPSFWTSLTRNKKEYLNGFVLVEDSDICNFNGYFQVLIEALVFRKFCTELPILH